jgi:hypothetical protein
MPERHLLSLVGPITLSFSKLPLLHRMASNDNGKHKMEEEAESSTVARKCLWHTDDNDDNDDSSDSLEEELEEETGEEEEEEEEMEEEVSLEVSSMNQLETSEEKLYAKRAYGYLFSDDGDIPRCRWTHHPHQKITGTPMRRAAMTTTSRCR